jgi:hypothetical protein
LSGTTKPYVATIRLAGVIRTDSDGIGKLLDFYDQASQFEDCMIRADCYDLEWIDANLAALLHAFDYRLFKLKNVQIVSDFTFLAEHFCFLFENGWLKHGEKQFPDEQHRTLLCTSFAPDRLEDFIEYVNKKLLAHTGTHGLTETLRIQMEYDLMEIFGNIDRHAQTKDPLFVCGHYYQSAGYFVFTMADLGVGFLPPIETAVSKASLPIAPRNVRQLPTTRHRENTLLCLHRINDLIFSYLKFRPPGTVEAPRF